MMKIKEIKKNKNGKYKIILDNDEIINTYDDVILNNGLLFHKEIDSELLNKLNAETNYYEIYNKTIKFIEKKLRSKKEIITFLNKNKVGESDKEKIINKLESIKLINDELFANAYSQDRINLSSDGPYKIINDLRKNDISEEIIEIIDENKCSNSNIINNEYKKIYTKFSKKYEGIELERLIKNKLIQKGFSSEEIENIEVQKK